MIRFIVLALVVAVSFFGCFEVDNDLSQTQGQDQSATSESSGASSEDCEIECLVNFATVGYFYEVTCGRELLETGEVELFSQLPVECQDVELVGPPE